MKLFRIVQAPFFFVAVLGGYFAIGILTGFAAVIFFVKGKMNWSTRLRDVRRIINEA